MATMEHQGAVGDRKLDLPPLSYTFQATQLLTPTQLERITIDQPQYVNQFPCGIILICCKKM